MYFDRDPRKPQEIVLENLQKVLKLTKDCVGVVGNVEQGENDVKTVEKAIEEVKNDPFYVD